MSAPFLLRRCPPRGRALSATLALLLAGCTADTPVEPPSDPPPRVTLDGVLPLTLVPRSTLIVRGRTFSSASARYTLRLRGETRDGAARRAVILDLPLSLSADKPLEATHQSDQQTFAALGPGIFNGTAQVVAVRQDTAAEGPPLTVTFTVKRTITPQLNDLASGLVYLNSRVAVVGEGLLLGGGEGGSAAEIKGCFLPDGKGAPCSGNGRQVNATLAILPGQAGHRDRGYFLLDPSLFGLAPGSFEGKVTVKNTAWDGTVSRTAARSTTLYLDKPRVEGLASAEVSMGQYLTIKGKGFVGGQRGSTALRFDGTFTPSSGGGAARKVAFDLVAQVRDGETARYVVEEKQGIAGAVKPRQETGTLRGSWTPTVYWDNASQVGVGKTLSLTVSGLKQVVWVRFISGWNDALRRFGLDAADSLVRARVLEVMGRDYKGINVEFRDSEPKDFKLYAKVDIAGADPNGLGLLGYDNTPGKDVGNLRLYDWIGGVNATTQQDGFPGFGGVFIESLLGFSLHPPADLAKTSMATALFDQVFDPFRPDLGSARLRAAEVLQLKPLSSTAACPAPAGDRLSQAACAVRVLGNIVGSTAAHELGHSLGLAEPFGPTTQLHNSGERPNRLMDSGNQRPLAERAELQGQGPAVFCLGAFKYLQQILPLVPRPADPLSSRPSCN